MFISLNGQLLQQESASISIDSEGLLYGYGVFETIKYEDNKIHFLKEHLLRLRKALRSVNLHWDMEDSLLKDYCHALIEANKLPSGALKVLCVKNKSNVDLILSLRENKYTREIYERGFKLCFTDVKRNPYALLTYIKSNNYMENIIIRQQAIDKNYDEVIYANIHDKICEGALTNIFYVKNNSVYTPSEICGLLPGIMRNKIIELAKYMKISLEIGEYSKEDLLSAEEVFVTNSLMEIMPVAQIEDKQLNMAKNPVTRKLRKHYKDWIAAII